ncbi:hypothetical protein HanRHA438_Chr08g0342631 [Helianthus annuus]|nr:hypothetical protein HanRHA438_Chr08g0342631 [Helianthus annuus]
MPSSIRLMPYSCDNLLSPITCLIPTNCSSTYPCKFSTLLYRESKVNGSGRGSLSGY